MTTYSIIITFLAQKDLIDIWGYVAEHDFTKRADALSEILEEKCESLAHFPERGHSVRELEKLGIFDFHEIYHEPYRIVYEIVNNKIIVYGILDSRRELKQLLLKRLSTQATFELV